MEHITVRYIVRVLNCFILHSREVYIFTGTTSVFHLFLFYYELFLENNLRFWSFSALHVAEKLALTQHVNTHEYTICRLDKSFSCLSWDICYEDRTEKSELASIMRKGRNCHYRAYSL